MESKASCQEWREYVFVSNTPEGLFGSILVHCTQRPLRDPLPFAFYFPSHSCRFH